MKAFTRSDVCASCWALSLQFVACCLTTPSAAEVPLHVEMNVFPPQAQHVHGSGVVELPNGDLLCAWFQGSGERSADDVAIMGARLVNDSGQWTRPFLMADVLGFPDFTPVMVIDGRDRLWMFWYTVLASQWETSMVKYRYSSDYLLPHAPPNWDWQDVLYMKPGGDIGGTGIQPDDWFVRTVERKLEEYVEYLKSSGSLADDPVITNQVQEYTASILAKARGENLIRSGKIRHADGSTEEAQLGFPYFRRMGWQTRNKPVVIDGERMIVPLYSDGFDFSIMAITDDWGAHWEFSEPIVGFGNIQPSIVRKRDGTLVTYMRDNGPPPKRLHVSESYDRGKTWTRVQDSGLPNPGSGTDIVGLANGHWLLVYNDTEQRRNSLAASISTDEGETWSYTRHLELDLSEQQSSSASYPAVIQGKDGTLHVTYSYNEVRSATFGDTQKDIPEGARTIKYVHFDEAWVMAGDA